MNIFSKQKLLDLIQMFRPNVFTFKNLPVEEKQRKWTDCFCTICSAIFALTLFILSFVVFHKENYWLTNYPVDDSGKTCNYEQPTAPYMYFTNPNDLTQGKYCVSQCPKYGQPLQCSNISQSKCVMLGGSNYSTSGYINRLGAFCIATDETVANHMWSSPEISVKNSLLQSFDVMLLSLLIGLCLGIVYLISTMLCPKIMIFFVFVGAFIVLLTSGILILVRQIHIFNPNGWNIVLAVFLIITAILFLIYVACYRKQLQLASIFMHYANNFLKETPIVFLYIPLFLLLTIGLIVLIVWQYVAFGTAYSPHKNQGDLFNSSSHNIALQVFNFIELIWGLQFLRDAFNFVISGNSVEWYFRNEDNNFQSHCCHPFTRLICKNWGSVAGGSFLNGFFILFDIFADLFHCDPNGSCGKCSECYEKCCCCDYIFQLVRTDAYAYINLTGVPYCNAARQCEALCQYSQNFRSSRSCLRLYRIAAHIFLVTLVVLICYFILSSRATYTNWYILALIIIGSYCISTYFVDIHADAAQGLMVSYLIEQNCDGEMMEVCPAGLRQDMYHFNYQNR